MAASAKGVWVYFMAGLILIMVPISAAGQTQKVNWDYSCTILPNIWTGKETKALAEEVYARTNGGFKINVHWGAELYGGAEHLRLLRDGRVQGAELMVVTWQDEPALGYSSVPFLVPEKDLFNIHKQVMQRVLARHLEEKWKTKILVSWMAYNGQFGTRKPVNSIADLKGLRIRVPNKEQGSLMEKLGATPVSIPTAEVVTAMQTGVADGLTGYGWAGYWLYKVGDVCPYIKETNLGINLWAFAVSLDAFNKLPTAYQDVLIEVGNKYDSRVPSLYEQDEATAKAACVKKYKVSQWSEKDLTYMKDKAKDVWQEWGSQNPTSRRVLDAILEVTGKTK